ncbi:YncE family protein [Zhihengliuella halotolerans]|uniref:Uncharacterized protein n=1 Tax=Zhihengliuella halotolerans TaxID=370736 RepID=A0A4Q8AGD8_9MICC|nr:hypothetical protein [Zhihengliuella halotolerans]RZU63432.1 hypothetical protein EV380_3050 [Zhihengliuella halotolerans]
MNYFTSGRRLLVADHDAGSIHLVDPDADGPRAEDRLPGSFSFSEHAGSLHVPTGELVFVDESLGRVVVLDPTAEPAHAITQEIPVGVPAEHLACDASGRYLAVTSGLGTNTEAWNDVVTVVDRLTAGGARGRRFRSRVGEPGVVIAPGAPDPHVVLRHRMPGAVEMLNLHDVLEAPGNTPRLSGAVADGLGDAGHGDVLLPGGRTLLVATDAGVETWDLTGHPERRSIIDWEFPGRGYFLRWVPERRAVVTVLRRAGGQPGRWHEWDNSLWFHTPGDSRTQLLDLGPGLIFRCAPIAGGLAFARVHPDGDEVVVVSCPPNGTPHVSKRRRLPALKYGPVPGRTPWEKTQRRSIAADPQGSTIAVSQGGEGAVWVVDAHDDDHQPRVLNWPTPLHLGGALTWLHAPRGGDLDTVGR